MHFVFGEVITHARFFAVEVGSAKLLISDDFTCSCLHERRATKEDCSTLFYHDNFVRHGRDIGTTSSAATHNNCNLGNTLSRHAGLVVKDTAEMIAIRENVLLLRQESTSAINEINAGKTILFCDFLGTEMFFHRDGVISTTFEGKVVGQNHALALVNLSDTCNDISNRDAIFKASQLSDLEERRPTVNQFVDAAARVQLVAIFEFLVFTGRDFSYIIHITI
jgi:hypothetical protein